MLFDKESNGLFWAIWQGCQIYSWRERYESVPFTISLEEQIIPSEPCTILPVKDLNARKEICSKEIVMVPAPCFWVCVCKLCFINLVDWSKRRVRTLGGVIKGIEERKSSRQVQAAGMRFFGGGHRAKGLHPTPLLARLDLWNQGKIQLHDGLLPTILRPSLSRTHFYPRRQRS